MNYIVKDSWLSGVADAIREKRNTTEPILSDNFASEIKSIESGGGSDSGENKSAAFIERTATEITAENLQGVTKIGKYAFYQYSTLEAVTIAKDIESIDRGAFKNCSKLKIVTFENDSKCNSIAPDSFYGCSTLESITVPSAIKTVEGDTFNGCTKLTQFDFTNIEKVVSGSFYNTGLTSVYLPKVKENINGAFNSCKSLVIVDAPLVPALSNGCFSGCTALTTVNIPSVEYIGSSDFLNCSSLVSLDLPKVTRITHSQTFKNCTALTSVTLRADTVATLNYSAAFDNTPIANGTGFIYVPEALVEAYKSATNWSVFAAQIRAIPE